MSDSLAALERALVSLTRADGEAVRLHHSATLLVGVTDWQARAADAFRSSVEEWVLDLVGVTVDIDEVKGDVRRERFRLLEWAAVG